MTVQPTHGIVDLFPQEARIGRHPDHDPDTSLNYFAELCIEKREALAERLKKNNNKVRRPANQLKHSFFSDSDPD